MHKKSLYTSLALCLMLLSCLASCRDNGSGPSMQEPKRSVYFWRTALDIDDTERDFLKLYHVGRMYVRMFDIVMDNGVAIPNRTIEFNGKIPEGIEIISVVFINNDVFRTENKGLGEKMVNRVSQMLAAHDIQWKELQIDFDWTQRNQSVYYRFLDEVRTLLKNKGRNISATIRLHQLAMDVPPVDYGALMVYNIGNMKSSMEKNSILSTENLRPYLRYLRKYSLPLATALPLYSWNLAFHHGEFAAIARGITLNDTSLYKKLDTDGKTEYIVTRYHTTANDRVSDMDGIHLFPGDIIRHEECSPQILSDVCRMISKERSNALDQVILYHLDKENIKNYKYEEIKALFGNTQ